MREAPLHEGVAVAPPAAVALAGFAVAETVEGERADASEAQRLGHRAFATFTGSQQNQGGFLRRTIDRVLGPEAAVQPRARHRHVRLRVVPSLWLLSQRRDVRMFQDLSALDVVRVSSAVVEPIIAGSIAVAALSGIMRLARGGLSYPGSSVAARSPSRLPP